ncbi:MFS transporter [Novosphingobium sp. Leaf2]|uniref:MFS transporter n=1 Tax=Novosphingobium sp. Leaf2 TaxID=1735670 RepID=UPI00138F9322|nr:MFS transporter [Novosphingobium sp. Leaf2]
MQARDGTLSDPAASQDSEFTRGWPVLLASVIGIGCGLAAIPFYTFGIFAPHLVKAFGWSLGEIMAGLMITTLGVVIGAPLCGVLSEKIGTRRTAIGSLVLFGLTLLSLATLNGSLLQFYITWGVASVAGTGTLPITFTRTVNSWFDRHRGLALGIAMMGTGLFGIACKPLMAWVIGDYGWRAGYLVLGALPLVVAMPIAVLAFRDPVNRADTTLPTAPASGFTRAQVLRQWRFWLLLVILLPLSFALAGTPPNLESILSDKGLSPATILSLTPLVGLAAIVGRLVGGSLLDRFWAPAVAFVILSIPVASYIILSAAHVEPVMAGVAVFLIGFALGIEYDVIAYLTSRYFGLRAYSAIYGMLYTCFAIGSGFAPLMFGMIHDRTHSFGPALTACAIILPLAAAGLLLLGRYPRLDEN